MPPQFSSANVFNIAVLAHVDHGKTTYTDSLLAANSIISKGLAGKLRFLDSRQDEQEKGITIESSAVSLSYKVLSPNENGGEPIVNDYVINLIDTPGHIDFSTQVSTASRLCDGALVLVDAVEGVCSQTVTVLRQAWIDRLKPLLVINKVDRLATELKFDALEAFTHLTQVVENVNAVIASFYASERLEDDLRWREEQEKRADNDKNNSQDASDLQDNEYQEKGDEDLYFCPEKGDVIFSSAVDGWAFRLDHFAKLHAKRLNISSENLLRFLWGDYYLDPKTKKVISKNKLANRNLRPMFVQFVLDNIWAVYENVSLKPNPEKTQKIIDSLGLRIRGSELRAKDTRPLLISMFSQWLPLASTTFRAIVEKIPSPSIAQAHRIPKILHPSLTFSQANPPPLNDLERDIYAANCSDDAHIVAYVSKMFAIAEKDLPQNKRKQFTAEEMRERGRAQREALKAAASTEEDTTINTGTTTSTPTPTFEEAVAATGAVPLTTVSTQSNDDSDENTRERKEEENAQEVLIGFSRLYSGILHVGQTLYCVLPRYNPDLPLDHPTNIDQVKNITIENLYMIMGRDLIQVDKVPAGNVFGIQGLEGTVIRNATLCGIRGAPSTAEQKNLINLAGIGMQSQPIVRVALEPKEPSQLPQLVEGLRLLKLADPCVETLVQDTGEHVMLTAGELHLERCLRDLRERFAKIRIQVSKPIVPFRETAVQRPDMAPPKTKDAPRGTIECKVWDEKILIRIRAKPLPDQVSEFLDVNRHTIRQITSINENFKNIKEDGVGEDNDNVQVAPTSDQVKISSRATFWNDLETIMAETKRDREEWQGSVDKIWSFGPKREGANLLIDNLSGTLRSIRKRQADKQQNAKDSNVSVEEADEETYKETSFKKNGLNPLIFDECIETAFQQATQRGPLCAEPVTGMAFFVESLEIMSIEEDLEDQVRTRFAQVSGNITSACQESFKNGMLDWSPRLMLAMYSCEIQATSEVLGKVYAVVARRRGRIISEDMNEGTTIFNIKTLLPVAESFGFAEETRKKTSGIASPQLIFHGFELLDQDPFWVPTTEEELEDLGEKADRENIALKYMESVRKRKGLFVKKKIVEHAEKQQTMKR